MAVGQDVHGFAYAAHQPVVIAEVIHRIKQAVSEVGVFISVYFVDAQRRYLADAR